MMTPLWLLLKFTGLLRVDAAHETAGLDVSHHGGSAYPGGDLESSDHKGQQYNAGMVSSAKPCPAIKSTTHQTCSMPSCCCIISCGSMPLQLQQCRLQLLVPVCTPAASQPLPTDSQS